MFLLLGGIFAAMEFVAIFLVREPTEEEVLEIKRFAEKHAGPDDKYDDRTGDEPFSLSPRQMLKTKEFYQASLKKGKDSNLLEIKKNK